LAESVKSNALIEIYVDGAVDNPTTTQTTTTGFGIQSSWANVVIDQDPATGATEGKFTAEAALTKTISSSKSDYLKYAPQNAGEQATYDFTFSSSQSFHVSDMYVIEFPNDFDHQVGKTVLLMKETEPSTWYIDCECEKLGTVWCVV
jgi:hypothetical protein